MDHRSEARDFLQSRRARLDPALAGLAHTSTQHRRVPGLRREEVALLAGVSVDYYTRLEKGRLETASRAVLDAIARALQLDPVERAHLHDLARAARGEHVAGPSVGSSEHELRPSVAWLLESMHLPAYIRNGRQDVVLANTMARRVWAPLFGSGLDRPNLATFCFLEPQARTFFVEWLQVARGTIALLRAESGRRPADRVLAGLIDRLLEGSAVFRDLWSEHEVLNVFDDVKQLRHPTAGVLTLALEGQTLLSDPGLTMVAYVAEPGSLTAAALARLAQTPAVGTVDPYLDRL